MTAAAKQGKPNEFRMVVDVRGPNSQVMPVAPNLPILELILQYLEGAEFLPPLMRSKAFGNFLYMKLARSCIFF